MLLWRNKKNYLRIIIKYSLSPLSVNIFALLCSPEISLLSLYEANILIKILGFLTTLFLITIKAIDIEWRDGDLRKLDTFDRCSAIVYKGDNFCDFVCFPAQVPFWNEVYCKRKEFASKGSKLFPFRVDSLSEGRQSPFWQLAPLKVGGGWVRQRCRVSCVTGVPNWLGKACYPCSR